MAILCGALAAAPLCRASDDGFGTRRCACGRRAKSGNADLDLHFLLGPCGAASEARSDWKAAVAEEFADAGLTGLLEATDPGSRERAAVMLGTPGKLRAGLRSWLPRTRGRAPVALPVDLQLRLAGVFRATLGDWHARWDLGRRGDDDGERRGELSDLE